MPISARVAAGSCPPAGIALDENLAGVDGLESVDGATKRGLARARRADNHDNLALANFEVNVLEHVEAAKVLVHVAKLDDGSALCGAPRRFASVST